MKVNNSIIFEIDFENRKYRMEMPIGAPLGEAYMATGKFLDKIVELINEHAAKAVPEEKEEPEE